MPWRTIEGEMVAPASMPQLEVLLRGVFDKRRFLDLVRHFIVFEDDGGTSVIKKMAGYHQFHAVRTAIEETIRACAAASGDELKDKSGGYFARPQAGGEVGDKRVEAIRVALRVAAGEKRKARGGRRQRRGIATKDRHGLTTPTPELFRLLLVESERLLGAVELDPQPVLATRRNLADDHGADGPAIRLELDKSSIFGSDRARLSPASA